MARNLAMKPKGFACVLCYYTGSHYPTRTLIHLRKNGERLPHSSMHNSSRNSATIIRKFRDQGSKFRHETRNFCEAAAVLCYYTGSLS